MLQTTTKCNKLKKKPRVTILILHLIPKPISSLKTTWKHKADLCARFESSKSTSKRKWPICRTRRTNRSFARGGKLPLIFATWKATLGQINQFCEVTSANCCSNLFNFLTFSVSGHGVWRMASWKLQLKNTWLWADCSCVILIFF